MPQALRVALLGYGLAGSAFHAPFIATTPGLELAAVTTRDPERRRHALNDHPGVDVLDGADDVWERAAELDLVVVATPNEWHVPHALRALEAGLSVVVDKPLALSAADGRRVVEEAASRGLTLTVFQNRRWDGDFLTLRRLIGEGVLGSVHRLESRFDRWRPQLTGTWREQPEAGGLLFDLGSHLVDQALQLFGPAVVTCAELDRRRPGAHADDDTFVSLEHATGERSHLWMSAVAAQPGARFRVHGDRAAFVKHGVDPQEAALREGRSPTEPHWGEEPPEQWGRVGVEDDLRAVQTEPGNYGAFYRLVARSLLEGGPPPVDPNDAVAGLELLEAARKVAQQREVPAPS